VTKVGCVINGKFIILKVYLEEVLEMMTGIYFEVFAPGMKAKLDPTYRRVSEESRLPARSEILGRIARSSHQSLMPFTTTRKALEISGRR
jgi:hypothetical protein